jgi:hypothetical protein
MNLYFGTKKGDCANTFVPFFAHNKQSATKMAREMDLKNFGRLTDIVILEEKTIIK